MTDLFELSYAGIPFVIPSKEVLDRIEKLLHIEDMMECRVQAPYSSTIRVIGLGVSEPSIPRWLGLYKLYVPTGATRFGVFRGLASKGAAKAMLKLTEGDEPDLDPVSASLKIRVSEKGGDTRTMWLLPPKPMLGVTGETDLYLITLVDKRYFFPLYPANSEPPVGNPSWQEKIDEMLSLAGIAADTTFGSEIEAVYSTPDLDSAIFSPNENLAIILDSCLANVGRVLVSVSESSWQILTWAEASEELKETKLALAGKKTAGGQSWEADRLIESQPRRLITPRGVQVSFPATDGSYIKQVLLSDLAEPYASSGSKGSEENLVFFAMRDSAIAEDSYTAPTNAVELDDLAEQMARDYYDHIGISTDISFAGISGRANAPHGIDVVSDYLAGSTRLFGGGLWSHRTDYNHTGGPSGNNDGECEAGCGWVAGLEETDCLLGSVVSATGRCAEDTDTAWSSLFAYDANDFTWLAEDVLSVNNAEYTVSFWRDHDPRGGNPELTLTAVSDGEVYFATLNCCGENFAKFSIGVVCQASNECPKTPPNENVVNITVEWKRCPNPLYHGPGWYCTTTTSCTDTVCAYFSEDPGVCEEGQDGYVLLCEGPFETQLLCSGVCVTLPTNSGAELPIVPAPCQSRNFATAIVTVSNTWGACIGYPNSLTIASSGTDQLVANNPEAMGITLNCILGNYGPGGFLIGICPPGGNMPAATFSFRVVYFNASPYVCVIDARGTFTDPCVGSKATGGARVTVTLP